MTRSRLIVFAWLLLLVPTLLAGGSALRLLRREQARIEGEAGAAAAERAAAAAEGIRLAVAEAREGILRSLRAVPASEAAARLEAWRAENPLVRNVFVWSAKGGLLHPRPGGPLSDDELAFVRRYEALFGGRVPWGAPAAERPAGGEGTAATYLSGREALRKLALRDASAPASGGLGAAGWIPWFEDSRLHFLAWAEPAGGETRHGVEVETVALLARLLPLVPEPPAGHAYVLLDDGGRVFHQTGSPDLGAAGPAAAALSLAPELPHWQFAAYVPAAGGGGASFLLVSSLVAGTFAAAILFGGTLLLWQAHRHLTDARRKTTFVSNVSHELKTPLTTIRMYAELLAEGRVQDEARRQRYLEVIVAESQRLARLVNNALDFSRLEQGRKRYTVSALDLGKALEEILGAQRDRLREEGVRLEVRLPDRPVTVRADRDALEQVVLNLVDNAIKYGGEGGELAVELRRTGEACEIAFQDRGPGVPAAHRERIFEKFHRVDDSLTSRRPGSGLGLTIARQLLRDQGGDLLYRPREGGGACFVVRFPCQEGTP